MVLKRRKQIDDMLYSRHIQPLHRALADQVVWGLIHEVNQRSWYTRSFWLLLFEKED